MSERSEARRADPPRASGAEAASLRDALERLLACGEGLGEWAHVAVGPAHARIVAAVVWGRWDRVGDDFYDTLPRYRGVPVGVDHRLDDDADRVELRDAGACDDDVVVAVTHWSAGRWCGGAEAAYVRARDAGETVQGAEAAAGRDGAGPE